MAKLNHETLREFITGSMSEQRVPKWPFWGEQFVGRQAKHNNLAKKFGFHKQTASGCLHGKMSKEGNTVVSYTINGIGGNPSKLSQHCMLPYRAIMNFQPTSINWNNVGGRFWSWNRAAPSLNLHSVGKKELLSEQAISNPWFSKF